MQVFDLTHAYQAFQPPALTPSWVKKNLAEIFLPLSRAMRAGIVRRGLQIQGWTIDAWLAVGGPVRELAIETLENLREAVRQGHIELGASAYSHPIVPLLSDELIERQIKEDLKVVERYLGKPTWFWFPEAALDKRSLTILHKEAPDLVAVIPDGSLGRRQFSGFVKIGFGGKPKAYQRTIVANTLLKDVFMNAEDYGEKPRYIPAGLDWAAALKAAYSGEAFAKLVDGINISENAVLARDLENAGSKYGLVQRGDAAKEVGGLAEAGEGDRFHFALPSEVSWEGAPLVSINEIKASCWEPLSEESNPYPYWVPARPSEKLLALVAAWRGLIETFSRVYRPNFPKECLLILASDVPWHFLGRREWDLKPHHSLGLVQQVILPIVQEIGSLELSEAADELAKIVRSLLSSKTDLTRKDGS